MLGHFHSIPQSQKDCTNTLARLIEKNFLSKDYYIYLGLQCPETSKKQHLKVRIVYVLYKIMHVGIALNNS